MLRVVVSQALQRGCCMSTVRDQLNALIRGSAVKRFHTVSTITTETVGEHSHSVAMLALIITDRQASAALLAAALVHDLAEYMTGDIPAPLKRLVSDRTRVDLKDFEANILVGAGLCVWLNDEDKRILKCCDILSGLLFCAKEFRLGNTGVLEIACNFSDYYEELVIPVSHAGRARVVYDTILEVFRDRK